MDIIEHSQSLLYAVVERGNKIYAFERKNIMLSDKVLVWTSTMLNAKAWRGALISDGVKNYDRQWSPVYTDKTTHELADEFVEYAYRTEQVQNRCSNDTGNSVASKIASKGEQQ
tara:strand:+ start:1548 stop:1889 length:342 start_codon:yes stop_codon:yes gene_type:complete